MMGTKKVKDIASVLCKRAVSLKMNMQKKMKIKLKTNQKECYIRWEAIREMTSVEKIEEFLREQRL